MTFKKGNVLKIGISTLQELEERVKAYASMNKVSQKKRYVVPREDIYDPNGNLIVKKAQIMDLPIVKLLRRFYKPDHEFKIFAPDEGIAIVSSMSDPNGIKLTMDLVTQIMNIGGGAYEAFIDRAENMSELINMYNKGLFPKLVIIGYIPPDPNIVKAERETFLHLLRIDPFVRALEITHSEYKKWQFFPKLKNIEIDVSDPKTWHKFVIEIIMEYTKPYLVEEQ